MVSRSLWLAPLLLLACGGSSGTTDAETGTTTTGGMMEATTSGTTSGPTTEVPEPTSGPEVTSTTSTTSGATEGDTSGTVDPTSGSDSSTGAAAPMSLDDVVDGDLELISDGHMFTEGPLWSPDGYLLFSDIPADTIFRWTEANGSEAFITPSGNSNGLAFDGMGRLLAAEHGGRRISRRVIGEDAALVVGEYMGLPLNSPNDVVWRSDGTLYFTDPPYGINPNDQEQPFQGVFRVDPNGDIFLIADDFDRPNGLVLSPDESLLYVDDTALEHVRVFDVMADGSTSGGGVFVALPSDLPGDPDGMAIDEFGDVYVTGGGGVRVVTPDAEVLGTIAVPESATNCKFGGDDGRWLFITAPPRVYRVHLKVAGVDMP